MLNVTDTQGTIFDVRINEATDKNKANVVAHFSTGKRNQNGSYDNMSWNVKFVGDTVEAARALRANGRIKVMKGILENRYDKTTGKTFLRLNVLDFERLPEREKDTTAKNTGNNGMGTNAIDNIAILKQRLNSSTPEL